MTIFKPIKKEKLSLYLALFLTHVVFSIDLFIQWGMLSGILYLIVLLPSFLSAKTKQSFLLALLISAYMFFELIVLSYKGEIMQNVINHGFAFIVVWVFAVLIWLAKKKRS